MRNELVLLTFFYPRSEIVPIKRVNIPFDARYHTSELSNLMSILTNVFVRGYVLYQMYMGPYITHIVFICIMTFNFLTVRGYYYQITTNL